ASPARATSTSPSPRRTSTCAVAKLSPRARSTARTDAIGAGGMSRRRSMAALKLGSRADGSAPPSRLPARLAPGVESQVLAHRHVSGGLRLRAEAADREPVLGDEDGLARGR